jgi:hypothetical protein
MPTVSVYEDLATDFLAAFNTRDPAALQRLNHHYRREYTFEDLAADIWRRVYAYRQRSSRSEPPAILVNEARTMVAQDAGYPSWTALLEGAASGVPGVPPLEIDTVERRVSPRRQLLDHEWDALIAALVEHEATALDAGGLMSDAVLARLPKLPHLTSLSLEGSRQVTDAGLHYLTRMPQLEFLQLNGTRITDHGLQTLQALPRLKRLGLPWQRGISDAGIAHLQSCVTLEAIDLMGTSTGDGAIAALQHKPHLRTFSSGRLVTDAGLALLQNFPAYHSTSPADGPARLLIDGPFTDAGLASLVRLQGLNELDLFWHSTGVTAEGFAHLAKLPRLFSLGADGALTTDRAMQYMAEMPALRKLRAQEAVATDTGFEALARSHTLESFWGRECEHFGDRGFVALSKMPTLQELGIGCGKVSDAALAVLPEFPALRSLTPIGVTDPGFGHIGRCKSIERLTCMYCRDTTDAATEQITRLPLRYYYAGLTQITDRSLALLGQIETLDQVEFYETTKVTDTGLPFLAQLPKLREVAFDHLPGVTLQGTRVFPASVRVRYTT